MNGVPESVLSIWSLRLLADAIQGCAPTTLGIWGSFLVLIWGSFTLDRRLRGPAGFAPAAIVFAVLGWVLRDRSLLLADSRLWIHTVQAMGAEAPPHRAPLATRIMAWAGGTADPGPVLALLSILAGIAVALGLWWGMQPQKATHAAGDRSPGPMLWMALIAWQPLSFVFYGHVESYPLLAVVLVWFLAAVRRDRLRGRLSPWTPILLLLLGFTHLIGLLVLPALLAWAWSGKRESGMVWRFCVLGAALGGGVLFLPGISDHLLWKQGWSGAELAAYSVDILNGWFLVMLIPGVVFVAFRKHVLADGYGKFLALAGTSFLLLPFLGTFDLGIYRDLDLLTPAWITFTFLAAHVWRDAGTRSRKMLGGILGLGALILASELALTLCPRGPVVMERHLTGSVMTRVGRVYGYEILAFNAQDRGEFLNAERHMRNAIRLNPGNKRLFGPLGEIQLARGDTLSAMESLKTSMDSPRAMKSGPLLAEVLAKIGRPQETIQILEANRPGMMKSSKAAAALAVAYFQVGLPDSTVAVAAARLAVDPRDHVALYNLASGLAALERYAEAETALRGAVDLVPDRIEYHRRLVQLLLLQPGGEDKARLYVRGLDPEIAAEVVR